MKLKIAIIVLLMTNLVFISSLFEHNAQGQRYTPAFKLEWVDILNHMSIVYLDDGFGNQLKTIRIEGVNVQIVNGLNATNGYPQDPNTITPNNIKVNGLGNFIVGYNELGNINGDNRTGSHNIILGQQHSYNSFGGFMGGDNNSISAPYSTVSGGSENMASGAWSSVTGGYENKASGEFTSVTAGWLNVASTYCSSVSGGQENLANGHQSSSVTGGQGNMASGGFSTVTGGVMNKSTGEYSNVCSGNQNTAAGHASGVLGGSKANAGGDYSVVCGGASNSALGKNSTIGGGHKRDVNGEYDWRAGTLFEDL